MANLTPIQEYVLELLLNDEAVHNWIVAESRRNIVSRGLSDQIDVSMETRQELDCVFQLSAFNEMLLGIVLSQTP